MSEAPAAEDAHGPLAPQVGDGVSRHVQAVEVLGAERAVVSQVAVDFTAKSFVSARQLASRLQTGDKQRRTMEAFQFVVH